MLYSIAPGSSSTGIKNDCTSQLLEAVSLGQAASSGKRRLYSVLLPPLDKGRPCGVMISTEPMSTGGSPSVGTGTVSAIVSGTGSVSTGAVLAAALTTHQGASKAAAIVDNVPTKTLERTRC